MRINIATSLKTRTGAPSTKDARLQNAYIETKGQDAIVRKRCSARGGVKVGTGTAQGAIGLAIGGTNYIYVVNGDVGFLSPLTAGSTITNYSASTIYAVGDSVFQETLDPTDPFANPPTITTYYCMIPGSGFALSSKAWSTTPPTATRYQATVTIALGNGTVSAMCGSADAAGYSCWNNYTYKSCATKYGPTLLWYLYDSAVAGILYFHGYNDAISAPVGSCTSAPVDLGVSAVGTIATF